ncbi:vesicle transport through interaction with t-SNAREs homolog 1A [Cimex lectularius]|uniref:Vesicle transport v-SNARE N-terminal domain-containing protein n=1 Tax=Cimex lectularius TaxID=79782 RepID=A0A8I6SEJ9_CIMLE|nr:vesicle transport through interaction with t-SNAREs homolog 1A [Cimex lectularius]
MESLLDHYEQQYAVSTADFTAKLAKISHLDRGGQLHLAQELEKQIDELKELLEQMDLEVRELDPLQRAKLRTRIDSYKAELTRLQQEFRMKATINSSNSDGYTSHSESYGELSLREEQKQRLLDSSERIERSSKKLAASYSVLLETEEMGNTVLRDLHSQRETISKSRSRLRETEADLSRSSRLLSAMVARSRQHKFILSVMAFVFLIIVIFSIYYSATRSN